MLNQGRMMRTLLAVLLLLSLTAYAADAPVIADKPVIGNPASFKYHNVSDKDVDAVKFQVYFVDEMGDATKTDIFYTNTMNLKAGKSRSAYPASTDSANWRRQIRLANPPHNARLKFVAVKVKFTDGSEWVADSN